MILYLSNHFLLLFLLTFLFVDHLYLLTICTSLFYKFSIHVLPMFLLDYLFFKFIHKGIYILSVIAHCLSFML